MHPDADPNYRPRTLSLDTVRGAAAEPKKRLRFAFLGAGSMGAEHMETTLAVGRADIAGVYDPNPGSVEYSLQQLPNREQVKIYGSCEEAAGDPDVDALIVSTPNHTHLDVLRQIAPFGKHILMEKPMAHTAEACLETWKLVRNYPGVFYVGFEYRDKPLYQELLREVQVRGTVGDVRLMYIMEHRPPFLEKWHQWNKFARYSGGTLVEKCCHYFDLFNQLAGCRPVRVYASGGQDVNFVGFQYDGEQSDILDNAIVTIDYENGARACLNLCMFLPQGAREQVSVSGPLGTVYGVDRPGERLDIVVQPPGLNRQVGVSAPRRIAGTGTHAGSTYYEHLRFIEAIETGQPPAVDVYDGLWAVAVGAAAEESARTGQPVCLPDLPVRSEASETEAV
jgi:predicted dehydrogenase